MSHECHAGLWRAQGQLWSGLWYRGPEPQHPQLRSCSAPFSVLLHGELSSRLGEESARAWWGPPGLSGASDPVLRCSHLGRDQQLLPYHLSQMTGFPCLNLPFTLSSTFRVPRATWESQESLDKRDDR